MKKICLLLLCFLGAPLCAEASPGVLEKPEQIESASDPVHSLVQELTRASLRETLDVLVSLETAGGRDLLPLFQALLNGELHYDESTLRIFALSGEKAVDVFSGTPVEDLDAVSLKKIRVNNRIRAHLHKAIARISLMNGDLTQRKQAARQMLEDLRSDNRELLAQARAREDNREVLALIEAALAVEVLASGADTQARLAAVKVLDGRLENSVRNLMRSLLDEQGRNEQDPQVRAAVAAALEKIEGRVKFFGWLDQVFFGLSMGSVLLLAAIGLAVTFGVMGVINMAHGEMLMLGAYTAYVVQIALPQFIEHSLWIAIPASFVVAGAVGILIQRYVIRYLNGRPLETLLATFGISLILQQTVRSIFSPLNRRVMSPEWMSGSWEINPVFSLTMNRFSILLFSLIVFAVLLLILKKTALGLQVRAVSENRDMARAMGIRTDRVDALTFGLGSGIAGIAGVALSQLTNVGPNLGQSYIIDSFMVVVFGGVGNLLGTLVGAFSLGVFTKFLEPEVGAVMAKILVLVCIILFIQKRPRGLFPQKGRAAE